MADDTPTTNRREIERVLREPGMAAQCADPGCPRQPTTACAGGISRTGRADCPTVSIARHTATPWRQSRPRADLTIPRTTHELARPGRRTGAIGCRRWPGTGRTAGARAPLFLPPNHPCMDWMHEMASPIRTTPWVFQYGSQYSVDYFVEANGQRHRKLFRTRTDGLKWIAEGMPGRDYPPGLRDFSDEDLLSELLRRARERRDALPP
jgi:hypothetical protein